MQTYSISPPSGQDYELDCYDDNAPPSSDQLGDILGAHTELGSTNDQAADGSTAANVPTNQPVSSSNNPNNNVTTTAGRPPANVPPLPTALSASSGNSSTVPSTRAQNAGGSNTASASTSQQPGASGNNPNNNTFVFSDAHSKTGGTTLPSDNPNGKGIIIYVNGSNSDHTAWTQDFVNSVNGTYTPMHQQTFDWDRSGVGQSKTSIAVSDYKGNGPERLNGLISELRQQYPGQKVLVIGHSNGGNVAVQSAIQGGDYDVSGRPDYIVRLGSPIVNDTSVDAMDGIPTKVLDVYNDSDQVRRKYSAIAGGANPTPHNARNWGGYAVGSPQNDDAGVSQHMSLISPQVWNQIQEPLLANGFYAGLRRTNAQSSDRAGRAV